MAGPLLNPDLAEMWHANSVMSGRARRYEIGPLAAPLSIKTIRNGSALWRVGKREFEVGPDCLLVVNEGQEYELLIRSGEPVETMCFFFARGYVEEACAARCALGDLDPPFSAAVELPNRLELKPALLRRFAGRDPKSFGDDSFVELAEFLADLRAGCREEPVRLDSVREATRTEIIKRLDMVRDVILSSLDRPLTLAEMAQEVGLSRFHLHRLFRAVYGKTPHRYLTDARLARADRLLRETELEVAQVCLSLGFSSESSFSRLYKRKNGRSPGATRRLARSDN